MDRSDFLRKMCNDFNMDYIEIYTINMTITCHGIQNFRVITMKWQKNFYIEKLITTEAVSFKYL